MVDRVALDTRRAPDEGSRPSARAGKAEGTLLDAYLALCARATVSPPQSAAWVSAWLRHLRPDALVVLLERDGTPVAGLALEVTASGPFKVARLLGERHANGNFPPVATAGPLPSAANLKTLAEAVARARPDIDVLSLERLLTSLHGQPNPWLALGHGDSPNLSLAVDLSGGFAATLERASGKKRKKHRAQARKMAEVGGSRRITAMSRDEADLLLDAFFAMKETRFARMGIVDVFADPAIRSFFRELFGEAVARQDSPFVLHGLEVAGRLRAVTGSSLVGDRIVCEFGGIADDELAYTSPGDFLFYENIEEAANRGLAIYDFSVGDDPYKRRWCDIERRDAEVVLPLTAKGRALSALMRLQARTKAFIKGNPTIWALTKRLRRILAGKKTETEGE